MLLNFWSILFFMLNGLHLCKNSKMDLFLMSISILSIIKTNINFINILEEIKRQTKKNCFCLQIWSKFLIKYLWFVIALFNEKKIVKVKINFTNLLAFVKLKYQQKKIIGDRLEVLSIFHTWIIFLIYINHVVVSR